MTSVTLSPTVTDDGWGGDLGYAWVQVSGPGEDAVIGSPDARETVITFPDLSGVYVFRITVSRALDALVASALWGVTVYGTDTIPPGEALGGPIVLTVNDVARVAVINTTRISDSLGSASCVFTMHGERPAVFNQITLDRDDVRLFGGVCLSVTITYQERVPFYEVSCVGYAWHLTRARVTKSYASQPIGSIAIDLLSLAPGGISDDAVEADLPSVAISFEDVSIADALSQLVQLRRDLHWRVDAFKTLHLTTMETATLDPRPIDATHPALRGLAITLDGTQVVNRVTVTYAHVTRQEVYSGSDLAVDSEDGYDPGGGTTTIDGATVTYSGVRTRPTTFYDRTTVGLSGEQLEVDGGELQGDLSPAYAATLLTPYGETNPVGHFSTSVPYTWEGANNALKIKLESISNSEMAGPHAPEGVQAVNIYKKTGATGKLIGQISPQGGSLIDTRLFENVETFEVSLYKTTDDYLAIPNPGERLETFLTGVSGFREVSAPASVTRNDTAAQAALAAALGGDDDGVIALTLDAGTLSGANAAALAQSFLEAATDVRTQVSCSVQDDAAVPGQFLSVSLPEEDLAADLKIQSVSLSGFELGVAHWRTVTAAVEEVTLDQLLRVAVRPPLARA